MKFALFRACLMSTFVSYSMFRNYGVDDTAFILSLLVLPLSFMLVYSRLEQFNANKNN